MGTYHDGESQAEGDESDDGGSYVKIPNDHIILLVDARRNMFKPLEDGSTSFDRAMRAGAELMKRKVVANDKHRVGLTLFGTRNTSDIEEETPKVFVALDLAPLNAKRIKNVEMLARGEGNFEKRFGSMEDGQLCPLRGGLWSCQKEFVSVKDPLDYKRIWLFTNDDDPLKDDEVEQSRVKIVAKDAMDTGVEIQLMSMRDADHRFDADKFYRTVIIPDGDAYNDQDLGDGAGDFTELMDNVRRKEFKKRRLARMPFHLREGLPGEASGSAATFDVQLYNMIHAAKAPPPIYLTAKNFKPMQVISKMMDDSTGAQLDEHDVRTYLEFAGERAYVTKDEMASLKALFPKGLTLLAFKKLCTLRPDYNFRSPYFLYPDEDSTKGSSKAFIALHEAMLARGVYALARFVRATGAAPRLVALVPQTEQIENGNQMTPPGMHVIVLPFADEVREPKTSDVVIGANQDVKWEVSQEGVSAARKLINALQLESFECRNFDNPTLQRHYAALQALALGEEEVLWDPKKEDTSRPRDEDIDAAAGDCVETFKVTYGGDQDDVSPPSSKRIASAGEESKKRIKTEGDNSKVDWRHASETGELDQYTATALKTYLKSQGLAVSGKKADLVKRIEQSFT